MKILDFFRDETNQLSSTRLIFVCSMFTILIIWAIACLTSYPIELAEIPMSVQTFIGILMAGKVTQKYTEEKNKYCIKE